jgi:hypothetical protein
MKKIYLQKRKIKKWRKLFWGKEWKQLNYILDQIGHTHSQLACKKHSHIMYKAPK